MANTDNLDVVIVSADYDFDLLPEPPLRLTIQRQGYKLKKIHHCCKRMMYAWGIGAVRLVPSRYFHGQKDVCIGYPDADGEWKADDIQFCPWCGHRIEFEIV